MISNYIDVSWLFGPMPNSCSLNEELVKRMNEKCQISSQRGKSTQTGWEDYLERGEGGSENERLFRRRRDGKGG